MAIEPKRAIPRLSPNASSIARPSAIPTSSTRWCWSIPSPRATSSSPIPACVASAPSMWSKKSTSVAIEIGPPSRARRRSMRVSLVSRRTWARRFAGALTLWRQGAFAVAGSGRRVARRDRFVWVDGRADVGGLRTDQPVVRELFEDVCGPAGDAAASKHAGEFVGRNAEARERRRGVELDVRIDLLPRLLFAEHLVGGVFERASDEVPLRVRLRGERLRHALELGGTRIANLVLAVTHSHDLLMPREQVAHVLFGFFGQADLFEVGHDLAGRAPVQVAGQR